MALSDSQVSSSSFPEVVELNVGGQLYTTRLRTLTAVPDSLLWSSFSRGSPQAAARDSGGRFFFDRDGFLFRYILDYLRDSDFILPDSFTERSRLKKEADFFLLHDFSKRLGGPPAGGPPSTGSPAGGALLGVTSTGGPPSSGGPPSLESSGGGALLGVSPAGGLLPGTPLGVRTGYVTIGYRGTYTIGRDFQTDARFRKIGRAHV